MTNGSARCIGPLSSSSTAARSRNGRLERGAAAGGRAWSFLIGVADGMAAAHAAGVLHRDVKPANILIDSSGYAKLADFGLAKLLDTPAESAPPTRTGVVLGTVAYMSPEQAVGQPLDERSDVFSFGIVLYELPAGRRPFAARSELEVLKAIADAPYEPLPDTVPEPLRAIVDKALEKDPADRYQTMRDLVVDLRRVLRKTKELRAESPSEALRRARRWSAIAAGFAVAFAAALVPASPYFLRPAAPSKCTRSCPHPSTSSAVSRSRRTVGRSRTPRILAASGESGSDRSIPMRASCPVRSSRRVLFGRPTVVDWALWLTASSKSSRSRRDRQLERKSRRTLSLGDPPLQNESVLAVPPRNQPLGPATCRHTAPCAPLT